MGLEKTNCYRLRWFDFDRFDHIQPTTVLDLFQDVATIQAEEMGIGWADMQKQNVFWALVRIKYEILQEPHRDQIVSVRTWPHTPSKVSFLRDYDIQDEFGNLLIKGSSEWVLINCETRKFSRVADVYKGSMDFLEERAFDVKPKKLKVPSDENLPTYTTTPRFTEIDKNGHVNNSRYPDFVLDAWNPTKPFAIKTLQIDYRHEVRPDIPLTIHSQKTDSGILSAGMFEDQTTAFTCEITFTEERS